MALAAAAAAATVLLSVTPDPDSGVSLVKPALAGNHGGGGGNGGGGNGGGGNGGGGNGGGNNGGGNGASGGTGTGSGTPEFGDGGSNDTDHKLIVEQGISVAQFTTMISKRYPANNVIRHEDPYQAVNFFTEVHGLVGQTITHRWVFAGNAEYEVDFKIRGTVWKSWSTQILPVDKAGEWRVEVVDDSGNVLVARSLDYRPAEKLENAGDGS